jgi:hypothetical protein
VQALQVKPALGIAEEARGTVVPALNYMVRNTGEFKPRRPGHASSTRFARKSFSRGIVSGKFL